MFGGVERLNLCMVVQGEEDPLAQRQLPPQLPQTGQSEGLAVILPCCVRIGRGSLSSICSWSSKMGMGEVTEICSGVLDKKVDHRRLPIGPAWKRKYCVLSSDGMRLYRSKSKKDSGGAALRTVPLCHIKRVARLHEDEDTRVWYFVLETEQGEMMTFRCRGGGTGWVAQIQIQLIHYKVGGVCSCRGNSL